MTEKRDNASGDIDWKRELWECGALWEEARELWGVWCIVGGGEGAVEGVVHCGEGSLLRHLYTFHFKQYIYLCIEVNTHKYT